MKKWGLFVKTNHTLLGIAKTIGITRFIGILDNKINPFKNFFNER